MNISLNSYNFSSNYYQNRRNQTPNFKGTSVPVKSAFLNPVKKAFDKFTDGIAEYYNVPTLSNRITNKLSHNDNVGRIVDHMQSIGSIVISGMYMLQTLRNDSLDEKRKKTLAINQGLTLAASTAIAYFISERLVGPWNKHVAMKYAANKLNLSELEEYNPEELAKMTAKEKKQFFKKENLRLLEKAVKKHQEDIKNIYKEKHPEDADLAKFKKPNLLHYVEKELKNETLKNKLKGLDVLKSLIIFGSVYRFFGPVAVTPLSNWIGNKLFNSDTKKAENNQQKSTESAQQPVQAKNTKPYTINMPKFEQFINAQK